MAPRPSLSWPRLTFGGLRRSSRDFSDLLDLESQLADLAAQRKRAIAAEVKYGEDQAQEVARIEADVGVLEQRRADRSEEAKEAAGLQDDLEATRTSLEQHGGRFKI